ncbi:MAG: NAD(P)-binding domain-containing protein [Mycobacterium sp.]|nr:NAD(P)-binding domain-containing protein [Mycobacterium sp.]
MRIGIVGAGRIGGNAARLLAAAGHQVMLSFARGETTLTALAGEVGGSVGTAAQAVDFGEVVIFSVPWDVIPLALEQAGDLTGKIVVDTTNQFGASQMPAAPQTAAQFNAARMRGARYTKSLNTLTAAFQAESAHRDGNARVVQWICGDDAEAKQLVATLIADAGFAPVDLGGIAECTVMEAPRRAGAVYGEEYRLADARAVVEAVRAGRPIPPTPRYDTRAAGDAPTLAERFVQALGTNDPALLSEIYDPEVALFTPLGWPIRGVAAVEDFVGQFHAAYPGLRVTLHDQFSSADGQRVCFRFVIHFHNTGPFYGNAPTGEQGTMSETHAVRVRNDKIVEQFVGDNNFALPYQELVTWQMAFPRDTPDPNPVIIEATARS